VKGKARGKKKNSGTESPVNMTREQKIDVFRRAIALSRGKSQVAPAKQEGRA